MNTVSILWIAALLLFLYIIAKNFGFILMLRASKTYSRGERKMGADQFKKALNFPLKANHKLTCAFYVLKEGDLETADKIIKPLRTFREKKFNPARAEVYYSLVLWKRGELEQAVENLESLLDDDYRTEILYCNLGYLLIEKGDYQRALEVNLAGLDYESNSSILKDNLVLNYIRLGEWDKADEISEELLQREPGFPEAYYNRALVDIQKGNKERALELLSLAQNKSFNFLSTISPEDVAGKIKEIE